MSINIEEAIQQKQFDSEQERALLNAYYTVNVLMQQDAVFFKQYDLTTSQYNTLRILRGKYPDGWSIKDIRRRMLDKMSDAGRIVSRLQKKGLVLRKSAKHDLRAAEVYITEAGLTLLQEIDISLKKKHALLAQKLTNEEAKLLNELLNKIR